MNLEHWWKFTDGGKPIYCEEAYTVATLSTTAATRTDLAAGANSHFHLVLRLRKRELYFFFLHVFIA